MKSLLGTIMEFVRRAMVMVACAAFLVGAGGFLFLCRNAGAQVREPSSAGFPFPGTIEGFVYWDDSTIKHNPVGACDGFSVKVIASGVGSRFGTSYIGQVKSSESTGTVVYDVCGYSYPNVPENTPISVEFSITQPTAFSQAVAPTSPAFGPVTIIKPRCNSFPNLVSPTSADLFAHWGSCQNIAYDVNFQLIPLRAATRVYVRGPVRLAPGVAVQNPANASGPLLSSNPQQGMLAGRSSSRLLQERRPTNTMAGTPNAIKNGAGVAGAVGPSQTMSSTGNASSNSGSGNSGTVTLTPRSPHGSNPGSENSGTVTLTQLAPRGSKPGSGNSGTVTLTQGSTSGLPAGSAHGPTVLLGAAGGKASATMHNAGRPPIVKLGPPKVLRKTNPRAAQQDAALIGLLRQQRQLADQVKLPAITTSATRSGATVPTGQPQATGAITNGTNPGTTATPQTNRAKLAAPTTLQTAPRAGNVGNIGPSKTLNAAGPSPLLQGSAQRLMVNRASSNGSSGSGNSPSSIAQRPSVDNLLTCVVATAPPTILHAPTVFSPEAKYNSYLITGCKFGDYTAGDTAYIVGTNGFQAGLVIDSWVDNSIKAHLDPALAGVLDQNNITLVVVLADGQKIQKSGLEFYAARGMPGPSGSEQEVALTYDSMPRSNVNLYEWTTVPNDEYVYPKLPLLTGYDQVPPKAASQFQSFSFQGATPTPVVGWLFRYAYGHADDVPRNDCYINDIHYVNQLSGDSECSGYFDNYDSATGGGTDTWSFPLAPGFVISSYELYYENTDPRSLCGAWDETRHDDGANGTWQFNLVAATTVTVYWPQYFCMDQEFPPSIRTSVQYQSAYGLTVSVLGPRCVDPWTGQPDQGCIATVKLNERLGLLQ